MAGYTYSTGVVSGGTGTATTIAATITLTAGSLVVVGVKHEGTATNVSVTDSTGGQYTNARGGGTAAAGISNHVNGDLHIGWFYLLSSGSGSVTITATLAASRTFRTIHAFAYIPDGIAVLDAQSLASGAL